MENDNDISKYGNGVNIEFVVNLYNERKYNLLQKETEKVKALASIISYQDKGLPSKLLPRGKDPYSSEDRLRGDVLLAERAYIISLFSDITNGKPSYTTEELAENLHFQYGRAFDVDVFQAKRIVSELVAKPVKEIADVISLRQKAKLVSIRK